MREIIRYVTLLRNSNKGFMLLETLITFAIFLMIISLFPLMIQSIPKIYQQETNVMEIQIFFNQLSVDIRESTNISINGTTLLLTKENGDIVSFEKYQDKVRRRVNFSGHEIALQNINHVNFKKVNSGVRVLIEGNNGKKFTRRISQMYSLDTE